MSAKKEELTDMFTRRSEEEKENRHNVKTKWRQGENKYGYLKIYSRKAPLIRVTSDRD